MVDVVIVGGGPAGLSAALILARCCRSVLVCDSGKPRNASSAKLHGFLTREDVSPLHFLELARSELDQYAEVEIRKCSVSSIETMTNGFAVQCAGKERFTSRKILLATGVVDELPPVRGIEGFFGKSAFQCPFCDGYEFRGKSIAVYGDEEQGIKLARTLTGWSEDILLFTNGRGGLDEAGRESLFNAGVGVVEDEIECLQGENGRLAEIVLKNGIRIARSALFFNSPSVVRSKLIEALGCTFSNEEGVYTGKHEKTVVSGVFAAGNILRDVQMAIVAAAEGAKAAFGINKELIEEDLKEPKPRRQYAFG